MSNVTATARFEFLEDDRDGKIWRIEALHVTTTKNKRFYSKDELERGARSLSYRPLNINHNEDAMLPYPENQTLETDFDATKNAVIGRMRIADEAVNRLIAAGRINRLSVEQLPVYGETCDVTACEQHGVTFVGLALLTSDTTPGDGSTRIVAEAAKSTETTIMALRMEPSATNTISIDPSFGTSTTVTQFKPTISTTASNTDITVKVEGAEHKLSAEDNKAIADGLKELAADAKKECGCQLKEDVDTTDTSKPKIVNPKEEDESAITSLKPAEQHSEQTMSEDNSKKVEDKVASAQTAPATGAAPSPAAPAAKEVVSAPAASAQSAPAPVVNIDMAPVASAISEGFKQFQNEQQKQLEVLTQQLGIKKQESIIKETAEVAAKLAEPVKTESVKAESVAPKPSSRVDDSAAKAKTEAFGKMKEWFYGAAKRQNVPSAHEWTVNKDEILRKYTGVGYEGTYSSTSEPTFKKIEAITVSGGDMPQYFSNQIARLPGGRLPLNVRPYTSFVDLFEQDRANWYKIDGMSAGTITEGSEPSAASQTVTKITATPTIRGVYQKIGYTQVENAPFDLVQSVQDQMALSLIDDEASDLLGTVYGLISPTNWVNGNSGAAITSDDVASMTFKRDAIVAGKRLIQAQGHDVRPGNLVLFLAPKAYQELLLDTNLNNYYQFATPDITARGVLEMIHGVEIVVSDHVEVKDNATNDTNRNVLAVKNIAFGLASARDITFEAQKRNELQQILMTATQRVKGAVIDETATCRISSAV